MRYALALLSIPVTASLLGAQASPGARPASAAELQALLDTRVRIGLNPGIVAALITPAGRITAVAGEAKSTDGKPLSVTTLFEIGSITKIVTGTLFADAIRRGEVQETDRLVALMPEFTFPAKSEQITLLDLATHRSGLPSFPVGYTPPDPLDPWSKLDSAVLARGFAAGPLRFTPGEKAEYSNVGAGLLGRVLVRRARQPDYESLVRARFAGPLKLRDFNVALSVSQKARKAVGHSGGTTPTSDWQIPYLAGAGAINSTLDDMTRLAAACLDTASGPLAGAIRAAQRVRRDFQGPMKIGLHWVSLPRPDSSFIVWHNGGTGGFRTWLGCNHRTGVAAVVMTNSDQGVDDIGLHLVDPAIPLSPPKPRPVRIAITVDSATVEQFVGAYQLVPEMTFTFSREGSRLFVTPTGQPKYEVFAESPAKWFLRVVDATVEFERDSTGAVTGLWYQQGGPRQRAVRIR
jgi:CubicO group peptidase (beta-lactamase class C family)